MVIQEALLPVTARFKPNVLIFGPLVDSSIRVPRSNPPRVVISERYLDLFTYDQLLVLDLASVQFSLHFSCRATHYLI